MEVKIEKNDLGNVYYRYGESYHREDGPAVIIPFLDTVMEHWYHYGKRHRIDGPAIKCGAYCEWWVNGKRHRVDGPAIESEEDSTYNKYWLNGEEYSFDAWQKLKKIKWIL